MLSTIIMPVLHKGHHNTVQYSTPQYSEPLDSQRVIMYSKQAHWDQFGREHLQEEHHLTLTFKIGHSLD